MGKVNPDIKWIYPYNKFVVTKQEIMTGTASRDYGSPCWSHVEIPGAQRGGFLKDQGSNSQRCTQLL